MSTAVLEREPIMQFDDVMPQPFAVRVDSLPDDENTRARAEWFIGQVALGNVYIDPNTSLAPNTSLLEAVRRYKQGDAEAGASIFMNVSTAVQEALIKSGVITEVELDHTEQGSWIQHGQALLHVHANALVSPITNSHPGLKARADAETVNGHRIEAHDRNKDLEDYWIFEPSLVTDETEVPLEIATEKAGFFGDTMTAAFRLSTVRDGKGVVQTAFVAGVTEPNGIRHDIETTRTIYQLAGIDADDMLPLDFLKTPLLIPKNRLPNGVSDIVELYDELISEKIEANVAFGQKGQSIDYATLLQTSKERLSGLKDISNRITTELLARADQLTDPQSAIEMLAELVRTMGSEYAVHDHTIDPNVLGPRAAREVMKARHLIALGDIRGAQQAITSAQKYAIVSMCGGTTKSTKDGLDDSLPTVTDELSENSDNEACEYSGTFCYCSPYESDGSPASDLIEITVYRDKDGVAVCQRDGCGATMNKNEVTNKGGIYKLAVEKGYA